MKNSMIIKLLMMMYTVCARLEISDIKTIGETIIIQEENLLIHPDGPLNPLRGYIMHRSGYMYNKRFYAPEIDTEYSLDLYCNKIYVNDDAPICNYTRKVVYDTIYGDIYQDKDYYTQFHANLIKMFPSDEGILSIASDVSDEFTSFLIKDKVQPECMYILAVIFLLSEKVDIPIKIYNTHEEYLLVLKTADGTSTYINQKKSSKDLVNLIRFLKMNITNANANPSNIIEIFIEPTTYEEFKTGQFLNKPQFLVQSYIYEFIDTPGKYIEFIKAVYTLLTEQIEGNKFTLENMAIRDEVLGKYFIRRNALWGLKNHAAVICDLKKTIDGYRNCPFIDTTELPTYTRVKAYDRENDKEIDDDAQKYINRVEVTILELMCCLMYDPETKKYNTDHLTTKKETEPLKQFFKKYPVPTESVSREMHQDWCRVIASSTNDKILYARKGKNQLETGLLNMLYVISDITGNKEEVLKEIENMIIARDSNEAGESIDIENNLSVLLKALAKDKNLEISCDHFRTEVRADETIDFFDDFDLVYIDKIVCGRLTVHIDEVRSRLDLLGDSMLNENKPIIKEKLTEIWNAYDNSNNYIECIIRHYISVELAKIQSVCVYEEDPVKRIILNSINTGGYNSVLNIFLYGRIESLDYKKYIVTHFLMLYANSDRNDLSLIRMTNNIIGCTHMEHFFTRNNLLQGYFFNPNAKEYYKKINEDIWSHGISIHIIDSFKPLCQALFRSTVSVENIFAYCFTELMKTVSESNYWYKLINDHKSMIKDILYYLDHTTKPKINTFYEIMNIIWSSLNGLDKYKLTNIYLAWFFNIFSYENLQDKGDCLLYLFNIIDNNYLIIEDKEDIRWSIEKEYLIFNYLDTNRIILCNNYENTEKYNKIVQIFINTITSESETNS
ncbi:hypothetical protein NEIG_01405 [Nematocida sp. ERTm5]|nr:hypothetical protein NEIG_01405 [Nematocida sp. ERTm5]